MRNLITCLVVCVLSGVSFADVETVSIEVPWAMSYGGWNDPNNSWYSLNVPPGSEIISVGVEDASFMSNPPSWGSEAAIAFYMDHISEKYSGWGLTPFYGSDSSGFFGPITMQDELDPMTWFSNDGVIDIEYFEWYDDPEPLGDGLWWPHIIVVRYEAPIGACCLGDGSCDDITEDNCLNNKGSYLGNDTVCVSAGCYCVEEIDCNGNGIPDSCDVAEGCVSDCNLNSVPDECDISDGTSDDINANGIPDDCECIADIIIDDAVNIDDLLELIGVWGTAEPLSDLNADGIVNIEDLLILLAGWGDCPTFPCTIGPPMEGALQWPISEGGNGHWYKEIEGSYTWDESSDLAKSFGGYLATITSQEESDWVVDLSPCSTGWLGGYQDLSAGDYSEPAGGWRWVTGESWIFTNWSTETGNPSDNGGVEHWIHLTPSPPAAECDGTWNDLTQQNLQWISGFIIEWQ